MTIVKGEYHGGMTAPDPLPRDAALDAVADLAETFTALMDRGARQLDLTTVRSRAVFALHEHGPLRQRRLGEIIGISAQQAAVIVDALIERGLLQRGPDPRDRRAVRVSLTVDGERTADGITAMRERVGERLLGDLSDDQLHQLRDLIGHVLTHTRHLDR